MGADRLPPIEAAVGVRTEIRLFGSLQVVGPNGRLTVSDFPSRKAKQVGAVLAFARGRPVSKDRLVDLLWGERIPRDPSATVEHAVSLLRSTLATVAEVPTIITERGRYRLDPKQVGVDLVRFDELVDVCSTLARSRSPSVLQAAAAVATDYVLVDEPTAPWAEVERDRYRGRIERVALEIAELALAHDDADAAHEAAERVRRASVSVLEDAYALICGVGTGLVARTTVSVDARARTALGGRRGERAVGTDCGPAGAAPPCPAPRPAVGHGADHDDVGVRRSRVPGFRAAVHRAR